MSRIVIVGGVAAGATAAARARRLDEDADITILEAGPYVSFANCGLPYYIGRTIQSRDELLLQTPQGFYDRYRVKVHTNTSVTGIDPDQKTVAAVNSDTHEESELPYDKLILAQGGRPRRPNIPGIEKCHVFTLWTMPEMDAIEALIKERNPERAVVVGGGFIGLEMAEALRDRRLDVSLVEFAPHVMPNLDPEFAQVLQSELTDHGISLHTGKAVERIDDEHVSLNDGTRIDADLVLMSIGVAPATDLARATGLELGATGGVVVNEYLESTIPDIYAAGDMAEITHRVSGRTVRIPLAGPANRQGRIAATNALGGRMRYRGAAGTSIVKLFDAHAGSVGLTDRQAGDAGLDVESIVVHKPNHATYYPDSSDVSIKLTYLRSDGRLLGAQVAGREGVDKRVDVLATAITGALTVSDLAELDLAYAPPFSSANDPVNMAAFVAENRLSGYGPSITVDEVDPLLAREPHTFVDVRDEDEFAAGHVDGAIHIPLDELRDRLDEIPAAKPILVYCESGQRSHLAARLLLQHGFSSVTNISGAYTSLERHARAVGFDQIDVELREGYAGGCTAALPDFPLTEPRPTTGNATVVDVRTPMEFAMGAYPGAINIPVDQLASRTDEIGDRNAPVTVYCASGSRSGYAEAVLRSKGFTDVTNGGGLMEMMVRG